MKLDKLLEELELLQVHFQGCGLDYIEVVIPYNGMQFRLVKAERGRVGNGSGVILRWYENKDE